MGSLITLLKRFELYSHSTSKWPTLLVFPPASPSLLSGAFVLLLSRPPSCSPPPPPSPTLTLRPSSSALALPPSALLDLELELDPFSGRSSLAMPGTPL